MEQIVDEVVGVNHFPSHDDLGLEVRFVIGDATWIDHEEVQLSDVARLRDMDVDRVDIGRAIVDAPLLDMKLDVVAIEESVGA